MANVHGEHYSAAISNEPPWDLDEARRILREGNRLYMELEFTPPPKGQDFVAQTAAAPPPWKYDKQKPLAAILSCADSRASPDLIFWLKQGHLFVIRTAGNTLDDKTVANLAYALHELEVPLVVVMGHEQCGAVHAAMSDGGSGSTPARYAPFVQLILRAVKPGSDPDRAQDWMQTARKNIRLTAADIVRHPHLAVGGKPPVVDMAYYHFDTGKVDFFGTSEAESFDAPGAT